MLKLQGFDIGRYKDDTKAVNGLTPPKGRKSTPRGRKPDRAAFWGYCRRAGYSARARASERDLPCGIDAHFIDGLLVDQEWRCAVSGLALTAPRTRDQYSKDPFAPSLDRIVPADGYAPGNVRIVANIVNSAMSEWGLDNLMILVAAMANQKEAARKQTLRNIESLERARSRYVA